MWIHIPFCVCMYVLVTLYNTVHSSMHLWICINVLCVYPCVCVCVSACKHVQSPFLFVSITQVLRRLLVYTVCERASDTKLATEKDVDSIPSFYWVFFFFLLLCYVFKSYTVSSTWPPWSASRIYKDNQTSTSFCCLFILQEADHTVCASELKEEAKEKDIPVLRFRFACFLLNPSSSDSLYVQLVLENGGAEKKTAFPNES